MFGSSFTTLIISTEEMNDIMKIVKPLEEFNKKRLLIKSVIQTIKNEGNKQKGEFLSLILGIIGASLLGNLLTGKGAIRAGQDF